MTMKKNNMYEEKMKSSCGSSSLRSSDTTSFMKKASPYLGVIFIQFAYAGMTIIAKSALNHGMNTFTFSVYRNLTAFIVFTPFALYFERNVRPRMNISIFLKITVLALLEPVLDQNLYYTGMRYTSASFTAAMCNVLPAITFLMAWIFRLERVNLNRLYGHAKIIGTMLTVGGAMVMTLVEGPTIGVPWIKETNQSHHIHAHAHAQPTIHQDQKKGSIMITTGCFCWACFVILQAITLRSYPAALSLTALICMMGALEGTILTFLVEKGNTSIWSIHWDIKLLAAVYSGIISSGVGYYITGMIMKTRGPVFVTAFNPLGMVIVAIIGTSFLAEQLNVGRVVGAIVIVVGLYLVVWGKSKDNSTSSDSDSDSDSNKQMELLPVVDRIPPVSAP